MTIHSATQSEVEERWTSLRRKVANRWPQLAKRDLQMIDGDSRKLVALVHQRTGDSISAIESAINGIAEESGGLLGQLDCYAGELADTLNQHVVKPVGDQLHGLQDYIVKNPMKVAGVALGLGVLIGMNLVRRR